MEDLNSSVAVDRVMNAVAVGTTAQNSAAVDTAGYEGVRFIVSMGTITDGTPKIKAQQDVVSGMGAAADLAGSGITLATTDDNKAVVLDIRRPLERYVRCVVDRSVGAPVTGAVIDGILAELYGPGVKAVSHAVAVAGSKSLSSPAEGTA